MGYALTGNEECTNGWWGFSICFHKEEPQKNLFQGGVSSSFPPLS